LTPRPSGVTLTVVNAWFRVAVVVCGAVTVSAAPEVATVRVWQGSIAIPTYSEGPANPNPPFDLFSFGRFNYPYPLRDNLTNRREAIAWRSVHLENEYLRLTVLPDLGGHVYSCLDKRTGQEMFYANPAIKKALIGYRGAWAAFGIEFNFPVSHNWMSLSPVDFATVKHPDGSASVWVGNVDQVYGAQWRVELRLDPGRAVLHQQVDLYNPGDVRLRYYWWNNAAVRVWDDSQLVYPTELMATHGFTRIERWPVDASGRDLSIIRNQTSGAVSLFTYGTREGFVGVYHPRTSSGTVHVASPAQLPTHKVWSWGYDRDAADWRTALSDDDSAYVELQSGLFRNQETYAFLEPQETVHFSEDWLPVRDLGGITRANGDAVLRMARDERNASRVRLALDVTRELVDARIAATSGGGTALDTRLTLSPERVWRAEIDAAAGSPVTFELTDAAGRVVLRHVEGIFDRTAASAANVGPQPNLRPTGRADTVAAILESGMVDELEGRRLAALARYRSGLQQHADSVALLKAAGRLGLALGWAEGVGGAAPGPLEWLDAAYRRNTTDFETEYYLGIALAAAGRPRDARPHLEAAQRFRATRTAAAFQLARLLAKEGEPAAALAAVEAIAPHAERASAIGALEVMLLRRLHRENEARQRAQHWQTIDPTNSMLRYELTRLGEVDAGLFAHFAADANRVLDVVDQYLATGSYADALDLLERSTARTDPPMREPGAVSPQESPLVAYYRGYVRALTGGSGAADYATAGSLSTAYVFPNRRSSYAVLESALEANPSDSTARFLLGSLYLSSGMTDAAIAAWQRVRTGGGRIPTLHRNLGLALLYGPGNDAEARVVLEEGTNADPENVDVYLTLDAVLSAARATPQARVAALRRYPSPDNLPSPLVFKLALALADAGDAASAERLFHDRFFPREEGGTGVRAFYAQVRLTSARVAADAHDCRSALSIVDALPHEEPSLPFTAGGLEDALRPAVMKEQVAAIEWTCGRQPSAQTRWGELARALTQDGAPINIAIADNARRRLGRARTGAERARLERALDAATATLESAGTSGPGLVEFARGLLLSALGRPDESRQAYRRVFLYPDRGLSHALARAAMRTPSPAVAR
jgi:tetratricopeptide (TPR) repeat protein